MSEETNKSETALAGEWAYSERLNKFTEVEKQTP